MKQNKLLSILALLLIFSSPLVAQESRFFMPEEIQKAYEKGTRSYDGSPGPNYWQNTVDYDIQVEVNPETREVIGSETITYHNESPDILPVLFIRLYQDVFKKGNQRSISVKESDLNDGMEIEMIMVDSNLVDLERQTRRNGTNMTLRLSQPIPSQGVSTIKINWKMVIPETTRRMGAYDSSTFFVAYWYPQIAVYDDVFGWDYLAYDFSTEFYNNLGNFDVQITAPEEFTVMATGVLQNPEEVFKPEKLELYNQAKSSDSTVMILSKQDVDSGYTHQSGTWHYKASEVTDFSFCLSDHFVWDAANQVVDGRNVLISSFYNVNVAEQSGELTAIQQKTMKHFSEDVPGVPYPYPEFTTCVMGVGGGGMETPMMANNGQPGKGVTIHEMFHTYFPMYVRVNEKRFAWMDEGWADFNTSYVDQRYFEENDDFLINGFANSVGRTLGTISDLPLITSTQFMDNTNYGYASYPLPAFIYSILHHHLGDDLFRKCYKTYVETWAKKSPTPYDFFYSFESTSGQDLSWLWKPWFFGFGDVDLYSPEYKKGKLTIKNRGSRPVPVTLSVIYQDSSTWEADYSAKIWKDENTIVKKVPDWKNVASITINKGIPDANTLDNYQPPVSEWYGDFVMPEAFIGEYKINEYPVTAAINLKDDLITFSVGGIEDYLLPKSAGEFESLSGNILVSIEQEENTPASVTIQLKNYGLTITGSKE